MKTIVCFYGGPGTGKSTVTAALFAELKRRNYNAEMNREYIKEWVWEGRQIKTGDQTYFFAKQARKERQYMEQGLEYIITDSPLILSHFYGLKYDKFEKEYNTSLQMLKQHHAICKDYGYKVEHIFLKRNKKYNPSGRYQTEEEAILFDKEMKEMLESLNIQFCNFAAIANIENEIADYLEEKYKNTRQEIIPMV
jgi:nicotinamide riboside kinase